MASNYGTTHMPRIVQFAGGKARSTVCKVALDGAALYMGSFVDGATGAAATPSGAEFGVPAHVDDGWIMGFVVGFFAPDGLTPIQNYDRRAGTVTDATGELPMKYTFHANNDESNTTSMKGELVEIMPVYPGDIVELATWGGGAISVARGTTTAWGTTTSSANTGVAMSIDTTYHFALLESTAAKLVANLDFVTTELKGKKPRNPNHVYAECVRSFYRLPAPD